MEFSTALLPGTGWHAVMRSRAVPFAAALAGLLMAGCGGGGFGAGDGQIEVDGTMLDAAARFGANAMPVLWTGGSAPGSICAVVVNGTLTAAPVPATAMPAGLEVVAGQVSSNGVMEPSFQFAAGEVSQASSPSTGNQILVSHVFCPSAGAGNLFTAQWALTLTLRRGGQTYTVTTPESQILVTY